MYRQNYYKKIRKIVNTENKFWSKVFSKEMKKNQQKTQKFSSYWWQCYYSEIIKFVNSRLARYQNPHILEAGAGSGKVSILLGKNLKRTLLDISTKALEYAEYLSKKFKAKHIKYVHGNLFKLTFDNQTFDFVWNIGVIEHYEPVYAISALQEMIRVTKSGGKVAIGVPNFASGPIIKARILKHPFLRLVPGYRLGTEYRYTEKKLIYLFKKAADQKKRQIKNFEIKYFGNPMPMETPKFLLTSLGKLIEYLLPKNKFLIFIICDVK